MKKYADHRVRRLYGQAKLASVIAAVFAVFELAGLVGSGGTITLFHLAIGAVTGLFVLAAVVSVAAARWLSRPAAVVRIEQAPPAEVAGQPAPVPPEPTQSPAAARMPVTRQSREVLAIEAPAPVVAAVETPETVPVA